MLRHTGEEILVVSDFPSWIGTEKRKEGWPGLVVEPLDAWRHSRSSILQVQEPTWSTDDKLQGELHACAGDLLLEDGVIRIMSQANRA